MLEITNRAQRGLLRPHHDLMAEQPGPFDRRLGQQPRSIKNQAGQHQQSINPQIRQAHRWHGAAASLENA
ncbi:MAG: hypothetical protein WBQ24_06600 [Xanthobacteraceae bacterium]